MDSREMKRRMKFQLGQYLANYPSSDLSSQLRRGVLGPVFPSKAHKERYERVLSEFIRELRG